MRHGDKAWRARFIVIKWRLIDANVENIYQRRRREPVRRLRAGGKKKGNGRVEMSERGGEEEGREIPGK